MDFYFRFAVEYMLYAESHFLNLKNYLPDAKLNTVPPVLIRNYLYLSKRFRFADVCELYELHKYQPNKHNSDIWNTLLTDAEVRYYSNYYWTDKEVCSSFNMYIFVYLPHREMNH